MSVFAIISLHQLEMFYVKLQLHTHWLHVRENRFEEAVYLNRFMYNFTHIGCMYGRIDLKKQSTSTGLCTTSHILVACMEE